MEERNEETPLLDGAIGVVQDWMDMNGTGYTVADDGGRIATVCPVKESGRFTHVALNFFTLPEAGAGIGVMAFPGTLADGGGHVVVLRNEVQKPVREVSKENRMDEFLSEKIGAGFLALNRRRGGDVPGLTVVAGVKDPSPARLDYALAAVEAILMYAYGSIGGAQ